MKPLVMRTKKLFQRGVKPSAELFNQLELPDNIYVLQAHTSCHGYSISRNACPSTRWAEMKFQAVMRKTPHTWSHS